MNWPRCCVKRQGLPIHVDWVFATEALNLEIAVLKVIDNQRMLSGNFPKVAQVHVHVPDNFHTQLLSLLLVINRRPSDNAIQLLHEKAPISTFEHREA